MRKEKNKNNNNHKHSVVAIVRGNTYACSNMHTHVHTCVIQFDRLAFILYAYPLKIFSLSKRSYKNINQRA